MLIKNVVYENGFWLKVAKSYSAASTYPHKNNLTTLKKKKKNKRLHREMHLDNKVSVIVLCNYNYVIDS